MIRVFKRIERKFQTQVYFLIRIEGPRIFGNISKCQKIDLGQKCQKFGPKMSEDSHAVFALWSIFRHFCLDETKYSNILEISNGTKSLKSRCVETKVMAPSNSLFSKKDSYWLILKSSKS